MSETHGQKNAAVVAQFNAACPVGSAVTYFRIRNSDGMKTTTRSAAWLLPNGEAVVMVDGQTREVPLDRIQIGVRKSGSPT